MDFSTCLSKGAISLSWPSFCVLRTFLSLFDISRIISWLYFLMFSFAFFLMVLQIFANSNRYLSSLFPTISRHFAIKTCVGDDILDFNGLLIALATLEALCWITSVVVSLMMRCRLVLVVSRIGFSIRDGIRSSLILFVWHLLLVTSWSSMFPFHLYVQFDVAHNHSVVTSNVDLVDDCYICLFVKT